MLPRSISVRPARRFPGRVDGTKVSLEGGGRGTTVHAMRADASYVAVVDDEKSVLDALGRLIGSAGYQVQTFSSGPDFIRSLDRRLPHCVVMDLHLPTLNGLLLQDVLAQQRAGIPVIVITGDDSPLSRTRALGKGARAYLNKPVDDVVLLDAIEAALPGGAAPPR